MCPHCGADNSKVVETRRTSDTVYRRRRCLDEECGRQFISQETAPKYLAFPREIQEAKRARLTAYKDALRQQQAAL